MFLIQDYICINPRGVYRIGDRQAFEDLHWTAFIGRTRNYAAHDGNGSSFGWIT